MVTTVQQQSVRFTGEQIAFGMAFLLITVLLLIVTHAWITSWFTDEHGRKDTTTYLATWVTIILLVAVTFFISNLWWFNFNGSGLRPVVQHWLTNAGWNIK